MRNGYTRERNPNGLEQLVAPDGEIVARAVPVPNAYASVQAWTMEIESKDAMNTTDLRRILEAMANEHYKLTTTRWQRCKATLNTFFREPVWGWLAFVLAMVVAAVGWMS